MGYFFPSFIDSVNIKQEPLPQLKISVNSGTNAIRVLLKSFKLPLKSKIAIPAFVCSSVKEAVEAEKFIPVLFDLKSDNTFWTFYDIEKIKKQNIKVIILVHLYGFIHPNTKQITLFCEENNIKLIHDAAQSYGIDEKGLIKGNGIVYSFGPGKSTTAAGGAWINFLQDHGAILNIKKPSFFSSQNLRAKLFFKTRIYGYCLSKYEYILIRILNNILFDSSSIYGMSSFQLSMASYTISNIDRILPLRKMRYRVLLENIIKNPLLNIVYDDDKGLCFKIILFVQEAEKFKFYLYQNNVPYFLLFNKIEENKELIYFMKNAGKIIEISCEASIPMNEIERISILLSNYK